MTDQLALMPDGAPTKGATFSLCGAYRYWLWRDVVSFHAHHVPDRIALFVMLNPSTAGISADDPTIRRCISFAAREGCGRLEVVNLFAFRATDPAEMKTAGDPVGPENDATIASAVHRTLASEGLVIAAWGAHRIADRRAARVTYIAATPMLCLGKTAKAGHPRHPLYVRADAPLVRWP